MTWRLSTLTKRQGLSGPSSSFREALAEVFGQALLDDLAEEAGQRRGNGNQHPEQRREHDACYGHGLKRDGDGVGLGDVYVKFADMGDELEPVDEDRGEH